MDYAIILAGGVGSRFWPLSRRMLPKQFLRIIGKETFFEATISRIREIILPNNIFIVSNRAYLQEIKRQLGKFKMPQENIILEPKPLNTMPAIALCAQLINLKDTQANLLVLPSDHYIKDSRSFRDAVVKALNLSAQGFICLMGIRPDSPCPGYGYIKTGSSIGRDEFYVESFKEKPNLDTAKKLFKKRDIFWNSGIFCFKAGVILQETKTYVPELYAQITRIEQKKYIAKFWPKIKPISIDYGILQRSNRMVMVGARFYWRDIGSWDALCSVLPKDRKNNVILSDCINLNSSNIFACAYGSKRLIAAIGLEDMIIVDTPDALLICKKNRAQEVKKIVEELKRRSREDIT